MKSFITFLAGIFAAILGASVISLVSGNNIALQFGGRGNTIEQAPSPRTQPTPAPAPQRTSQYQAPAPTQTPSTTTTQLPPVTNTTSPTSQPTAAPIQTINTIQKRTYTRNPARSVKDCSCPIEVSEDEVVDDDDSDGVDDYDCGEEPPTT